MKVITLFPYLGPLRSAGRDGGMGPRKQEQRSNSRLLIRGIKTNTNLDETTDPYKHS